MKERCDEDVPLNAILCLGFQVSCKAMAKYHVQLVHNSIIRIQTLNLRITCTRHYPIEPLINLNCSLIHMVKMSIDKHTTSRKLQAHISQVN